MTYKLAVEHALSKYNVCDAASGYLEGLEMLKFLQNTDGIKIEKLQQLAANICNDAPYMVAFSSAK